MIVGIKGEPQKTYRGSATTKDEIVLFKNECVIPRGLFCAAKTLDGYDNKVASKLTPPEELTGRGKHLAD